MLNRRHILKALGLATLGGPALLSQASAATLPNKGHALIMVDSPTCGYCARWRKEILPGYAANPTGRKLPLTIVPLDGPWPDGLALARAPYITPTFLLIENRAEIARIEGYPGVRHFWPTVDEMLAQHSG